MPAHHALRRAPRDILLFIHRVHHVVSLTLTEVNPLAARGRRIALQGQAVRRVPACAQCHGPAAHRQHELYPILHGQPAAYLYQQLLLFSQAQRGGTSFAELMHGVTDHTLLPEEMAAVAVFNDRGQARPAP